MSRNRGNRNARRRENRKARAAARVKGDPVQPTPTQADMSRAGPNTPELHYDEMETSHPAGGRVDIAARPDQFVRRAGGLVPLIAADNLPEQYRIQGYERPFTEEEVAEMHGNIVFDGNQGLRYPPDQGTPGADQDAAVEGQQAPVDGSLHDQLMSNLRANNARRGRPTVQKYTPTTPGVFKEKRYCTHWIRTGECDFTQQGCMYIHCMPDLETLAKIGFRFYPRWFREQPYDYQQTYSKYFDPVGLNMNSYSGGGGGGEGQWRGNGVGVGPAPGRDFGYHGSAAGGNDRRRGRSRSPRRYQHSGTRQYRDNNNNDGYAGGNSGPRFVSSSSPGPAPYQQQQQYPQQQHFPPHQQRRDNPRRDNARRDNYQRPARGFHHGGNDIRYANNNNFRPAQPTDAIPFRPAAPIVNMPGSSNRRMSISRPSGRSTSAYSQHENVVNVVPSSPSFDGAEDFRPRSARAILDANYQALVPTPAQSRASSKAAAASSPAPSQEATGGLSINFASGNSSGNVSLTNSDTGAGAGAGTLPPVEYNHKRRFESPEYLAEKRKQDERVKADYERHVSAQLPHQPEQAPTPPEENEGPRAGEDMEEIQHEDLIDFGMDFE